MPGVMIDSLLDDSFTTRQQQGAQRARRLARLRRLIELAEDPGDIFDSCTEFMEALAADSFKTPFRTSDPGAFTSSPVAQAQQEQSQAQHNSLLALTLCAALSEPVKRHEEAGSTSTLSAAAVGAGTAFGRSNSAGACWRSSPVVSSSRFTPAATQLHPSFSMPPSMGAASEMGSDSVGAAAAPAYELSCSFSVAQHEADSSYRGNPVCSANSSIQLQRGQLQPQRQHDSDAGALFQLLCQELQGEQAAQLPRGAWSPGQQPVRQQPMKQQQQPPQLVPDQEQQKAVLLERLKRAIAVAASRKSMEV